MCKHRVNDQVRVLDVRHPTHFLIPGELVTVTHLVSSTLLEVAGTSRTHGGTTTQVVPLDEIEAAYPIGTVYDPHNPEDLSRLRELPDGAVLVDAVGRQQARRAYQVDRFDFGEYEDIEVHQILVAGLDITYSVDRWAEELRPLRLVWIPPSGDLTPDEEAR